MSAALEQLVKLSGLSPIFANTVVRRAVGRAGVDPDTMGRGDVERVLPELERALTVYLGESAAAGRLAEVKRLMSS